MKKRLMSLLLVCSMILLPVHRPERDRAGSGNRPGSSNTDADSGVCV